MFLTRADFRKIFNPAHIAVIGVSTGDYKFGGASFLMKLQEGGYRGKLYPINPKAGEIRGLKAYPDLSSLPAVPDLAIVCVSARYVPSVLEDCAGVGIKHVHILTSGFRETGLQQGRLLEKELAAIAREAEAQLASTPA